MFISLGSKQRISRLMVAFVFIVSAIVIGTGTAINPFLISVVCLGGLLVLAAWINPDMVSTIVILSACVSLNYIIDMHFFGLDLLSFYKLGILCMVVPAMARYGVHKELQAPIIALLIMLIMTYLFSDWQNKLGLADPIKAFVGLGIPFAFLLIRWRYEQAERHIVVICLLAAASVCVGAVLHLLRIQPLIVTEFTGAWRLQGANIPAHLAMLAYIGFTVSLLEIKRHRQRTLLFYALVLVNLIILLLTGTRGPLLASAPLILVYLYDQLKGYIQGKVILIIPLGGFVLMFAAALYTQWDNLMTRTFERQTAEGVDLSGRSEAWAFFLDGAEQSPWFGNGLGSALVANDGSIYSGFVVPHNEYIRFYYDSGWIGAFLLFAALLYVFMKIFNRLEAGVKAYFSAFCLGFLIYTFSDNTLSTVQLTIPFCWFLASLYSLSKGRVSVGAKNDVQYQI